MVLHADNDSAIKLATNPICHKQTKHVKFDCHFITKKLKRKTILACTSRGDKIADFLTKAISRKELSDVLSNLGIINIYAST